MNARIPLAHDCARTERSRRPSESLEEEVVARHFTTSRGHTARKVEGTQSMLKTSHQC
jgi:hypothetical protein